MGAFYICLVHHVCIVCYVSVTFIILFMQPKRNINAQKLPTKFALYRGYKDSNGVALPPMSPGVAKGHKKNTLRNFRP